MTPLASETPYRRLLSRLRAYGWQVVDASGRSCFYCDGPVCGMATPPAQFVHEPTCLWQAIVTLAQATLDTPPRHAVYSRRDVSATRGAD